MTHRHFSAHCLMVLLTAMGGLACGVTEPDNIFGTYELRTIGGAATPTPFKSVSGVSILGGSVSLRDDGAFAAVVHLDNWPNTGDTTLTASGTFVASGGPFDPNPTTMTRGIPTAPVTFTVDENASAPWSTEGRIESFSVLTITDAAGDEWVFRR